MVLQAACLYGQELLIEVVPEHQQQGSAGGTSVMTPCAVFGSAVPAAVQTACGTCNWHRALTESLWHRELPSQQASAVRALHASSHPHCTEPIAHCLSAQPSAATYTLMGRCSEAMSFASCGASGSGSAHSTHWSRADTPSSSESFGDNEIAHTPCCHLCTATCPLYHIFKHAIRCVLACCRAFLS